MGHCEMLLAVAGMSQEQVDETTRRLSGDRSDLPAAEQAAYQFTRKQAKAPASITDADIVGLEKQCGHERAWQIIWWASRCHYMTKVADAFQLPLERENPFFAMPGAKKTK
jgi:hypothetical protein